MVEWENYDTVFLRCLVETSAWIHIIHSFRNLPYERSIGCSKRVLHRAWKIASSFNL